MDDYLKWLMGLVDVPPTYSDLMIHLNSIDFTWLIRNDVNRAADGLNLRARYYDETGTHCTAEVFMHPCSVLEMMVALACRIEDDIMFDPALGNRSSEWFWIMLNNVGLNGMDNRFYDESTVDRVIKTVLNRSYSVDGRGGLFPTRSGGRNQRRIEIWYQMCNFLNENFS